VAGGVRLLKVRLSPTAAPKHPLSGLRAFPDQVGQKVAIRDRSGSLLAKSGRSAKAKFPRPLKVPLPSRPHGWVLARGVIAPQAVPGAIAQGFGGGADPGLQGWVLGNQGRRGGRPGAKGV
jgi:hypothetical protein